MGLLELIAGENGLGWNGRLAMIHAGLTSEGARVAFRRRSRATLAKRYGNAGDVRARVEAQLGHPRAQARGSHDYLGGAQPSVLDAYAAAFATPLVPLEEADCPNMSAPLRHAFRAAAQDLGPLVPPSLLALRARMFEKHLPWPIEI